MKIQKKTYKLLKSLYSANKGNYTKKEILDITGAKSSAINSLVHRGFLKAEEEKVESESENGRKSRVKKYSLSEQVLDVFNEPVKTMQELVQK